MHSSGLCALINCTAMPEQVNHFPLMWSGASLFRGNGDCSPAGGGVNWEVAELLDGAACEFAAVAAKHAQRKKDHFHTNRFVLVF